MIRKQTWILLAVFVVLLGGVFYLQKNPLPETSNATPTVSPTPQVKLLEGWQSSDIVWLNVKNADGSTIEVSQDDQGGWSIGPENPTAADPGKVEAIRSEIAEAIIRATMPADYDMAALGLDTATTVISVRNQAGTQIDITVGNPTPTDTGYYLQIGKDAPVVVDKTSIDNVLDQMTLENLTPEQAQSTEMEPTSAP